MTTDETAKTTGGAARPGDNPPVAAALLVGSLFLLGLQDGLIKLTSSHVSLWQMQLIRASGNLFLLFIIAATVWGTLPPAPKRLWAVALRSMFLTTAMVLFFGGVPFLELSEIAAGLYVFPLFVAVLSALLLGEQVGPRRVAAVVVGFTGTLLILKPGTDAFQWISLMPVGAGLCYAATVLSTRRLCREENPVTMAFGVAVAFISVGIIGLAVMSVVDAGAAAEKWPYLLTAWHPLEFWVAAIILTCSTLNLTANISLTRAYQTAEASWLAPFDYCYLIFATFWGYVMWRHVPDALSILGMVLIAVSGTFVAWRERQLAMRAKKGRG